MLFPHVCDLFGDSANIKYLKASVPEAEIIETSLNDRPYFADNQPDLIYMGAMTENTQTIVCNKLSEYKERIEELIENNARFLITGNALEVFGKNIIDEEKHANEECLNLFDTTAKRDMMHRFNSLYLGKFEQTDIVGFKTQFSHSYYNPGYSAEALFTTTRSAGFNPDIREEGIRKNKFFATYIIGPLLVLNPPFTKLLLADMGYYGELAFEQAAMKAYQDRVTEYSDPKTGLYY